MHRDNSFANTTTQHEQFSFAGNKRQTTNTSDVLLIKF